MTLSSGRSSSSSSSSSSSTNRGVGGTERDDNLGASARLHLPSGQRH